VTLIILLLGFLFGYQATIGIMLGNIILTMILMFHSIITGSSLKNARYYKEGTKSPISKPIPTYRSEV
jgi:hypothetical protein